MTQNSRKIILVDMNAYFASVEQASNPELRGKAIVICGDGRTIVVTASYEARRYGIKTGMTLPEARRLCPFVIPVIGNLDKYVDVSLRIHKIMLEYTDQVEVFSIDECFLDVTGVEHLWGGAVNIAAGIKKKIKEQIGITCSAGVAPNKVVAKLAAKSKKPDGLTVVEPDEVENFMFPLPVEKLQGVGIGARLSEKFRLMGINTARDLAMADGGFLKARFGVMGAFYKNVGLGRDSSRVKKYSEQAPVKSVGHSHTLPKDTYDISVVRSYLLMLCEKTAARLRGYKLTGRTVFLMVRFGDFEIFSGRETLKSCFNTGYGIFSLAWKIFERVLPLKKAVRLLGVGISNLAGGDTQQYLFEDMQKKQKLSAVMDEINAKYGELTVKPSSVIIAQKHGILGRCGIISTRLIK